MEKTLYGKPAKIRLLLVKVFLGQTNKNGLLCSIIILRYVLLFIQIYMFFGGVFLCEIHL